jgi:hypothetical protein
VAALALALGAGGLYWRFHTTPKLTDRDTIVLGEFENSTGEEIFDGALKQALSVQLTQSPYLNIISDTKVEEILREMGRSPNERLTAFLSGDHTAMENQVSWAVGKVGMEDSLLSAQSDTEAYYGRLEKARDFSRRAVNSAIRSLKDRAQLRKVEAALREAEFGNIAAAKQGALEALALSQGKDVKVLSALTLARVGETTQAKRIVVELEKDYPSNTVLNFYWLPTINAAIELKAQNPGKALTLLEIAEPYERLFAGQMYSTFVRGQAKLMARDGPAAAIEFQKILDHRQSKSRI